MRMIDDYFYRAFEEKYRGSCELIQSRLKIYLPFIEQIKELELKPKIIDLGCGRGEWLQLLADNGCHAHGVDLDAGMLEVCRKKGLDVVFKDALLALRELQDNSYLVVSGFHLVEHLPFDTLKLMFQEIIRVLKPGGILIFETPNAENIRVASNDFYLDPTHIRPLPTQLLSFMSEYYGFERTKIIRMQEEEALKCFESANLFQVMTGVSPDYAIVSQKKAPIEITSKFDMLFEQEYGLSFETLADRFERRFQQLEVQVNEAKVQANEAKVQANEFWLQYVQVVNSKSWRVTKPIRILSQKFKLLKSILKAFSLKNIYYSTIKFFYENIIRYIWLKNISSVILSLFPFLKKKLLQIVHPNLLKNTTNEIESHEVLSSHEKKILFLLKK